MDSEKLERNAIVLLIGFGAALAVFIMLGQ